MLGGPLTATGVLTDEYAGELVTMFQNASRTEDQQVVDSAMSVTSALPPQFGRIAVRIMFGKLRDLGKLNLQ